MNQAADPGDNKHHQHGEWVNQHLEVNGEAVHTLDGNRRDMQPGCQKHRCLLMRSIGGKDVQKQHDCNGERGEHSDCC